MKNQFNKIFEAETGRVKSCTFHPKKPVLLVALHSGLIQSYDYQLGLHICDFKGHLGPVRAVKFHPLLNVFASGGDDMKIRLWDYQTMTILKTFEGHKDYIRSLDFHPEHPYLLSTSDDQTCKIWNFQSSKLIETLIGHTHYVMSGCFFINNYIVTGSLDQTIRLWHFKDLQSQGTKFSPKIQIKQIIDAHEKGVNGVSCYENMILTVSDDKETRLWEYNNDIISRRSTFFHHQNNVSSGILHKDFMISNGEDGILAQYNLKKSSLSKFFIEKRFWCLDFCGGYYAAGHDNGFYIFSLENVRPVYSCSEGKLHYLNDGYLCFTDFKVEKKLFPVKNTVEGVQIYEENTILLQGQSKFRVLKGSNLLLSENGKGLIINKDVILVLNNDELILKNYSGVIIKNYQSKSFSNVIKIGDNLLVGISGRSITLIRCDEQSLEFMESVNLSMDIQSVIGSESCLIVVDTNCVAILDYNLNIIEVRNEMVKINSCIAKDDVLYYSTTRHIKYLILNKNIKKNSGILKSADDIFLIKVDGNSIFALKNNKILKLTIDTLELEYKRCLIANEIEKMQNMIRSGDLIGLSPLIFLKENKMGHLAIPYVKDLQMKFELSLSNEDYKECLKICEKSGDLNLFKILSTKAKDKDMLESCYRNINEHFNLFILFICTKQFEKMKRLIEVADVNLKLLIARFLKDEEFIKRFLNGELVQMLKCNNSEVDRNEKLTEDLKNLSLDMDYSQELMNEFSNLLIADCEFEEEMNNGYNYTTEGKFNLAVTSFKKVLYSAKDDILLRKATGMYISGLTLEKQRRKISDPKKSLQMVLSFAALDLEPEHKKLALNTALKMCLKYENYKSAKELNLVLGKNIEIAGDDDKFEVVNGILCFDILEVAESKECRYCYVKSFEAGMCKCCKVGFVE